jgi:hypothetical protein
MLQREPAQQVICYSGYAIPLLPNSICNHLVELGKGEWALVVEASIESKAECIALVCCVATTNGYEESPHGLVALKCGGVGGW